MTTPQPQQESYRELRTKIGEILVKNNLRTDQVAISELAKLLGTSKESLQVDPSLCNSMSHRVYGKCKNCGYIKEKSTEPYVTDSKTPELTEEQETRLEVLLEEKLFIHKRNDGSFEDAEYGRTEEVAHLKAHLATELELQRRELATEIEKLKELCPPGDGLKAGCSYCDSLPRNKAIDDVLALLQKETI